MIFKEWIILIASYVFINNFHSTVAAQKIKLRYCMVDDTIPHEMTIQETCPLLVDSINPRVSCIVATDRVTCLRHLLANEVDFIVAEPEDLMIFGLSQENNNKLLVTHELPSLTAGPTHYQMVAIVRNNIKDIFHTEKKRFCSPGFEPGVLVRDYLKFFESRLTPRKCDPEKSLLENRMASLSEYFESACISGPWTVDYQRDQKLKKKYPNLCAQCGDSTLCSHEDSFFGKWGALKCLLSMKGDVTWATLHAVEHDLKPHDENKEYSYLCPDGKTRKLTDKPCIWLREPHQTVVVTMDSAEKVGRYIRRPQSVNDLWRLFVGLPQPLELPATPLDYLQRSFPEYYSLKDYARCTPDRTIKWCVSTPMEAEKCKWISFAAQSHGLEPEIKCIQEMSREDCMESVKNGTSDIFAVESRDEAEAKKRGLKAVAHMMTHSGHENITVALVHKFSNYTNLLDLKNHKACFPGYKEFEWNSFIYAMKKLTGSPDWYSKDKEMVSKFFNESCVGNLPKGNGTEKDIPKNLQTLCATNNIGHILDEHHFYRQTRNPPIIVEKFEMPRKEGSDKVDPAMFNCLSHNYADVAFVNLSSFMNLYPELIGTSLRVICLNGTKIGNHCYSAKKSLGSLVVNENISEARKDEIYFMMLDLDRIFGITYQIESKLISLYGSFNGTSGIIFPEGTQFLDPTVCDSPCKMNYNEILDDISTYFKSSADSRVKHVQILTTLVLACVLLIKLN